MRKTLLLLVLAIACKGHRPEAEHRSNASGSTLRPPPAPAPAPAPAATADAEDLTSKDIMARTKVADAVYVKHIVVSWTGLVSTWDYQDPRGASRSAADAAQLARTLLAELVAHPDRIDALAREHSEDPSVRESVLPYEINLDTPTLPELKQLALRLAVNEAGIAKTRLGYDIIERVAPPPPDPLESAEILRRPVKPGEALVQHVMIAWKDDKAGADKRAQEVLAKARAGGDFAGLMKQYSDDPATRDPPQSVEVESATDPQPFARLAMRLAVGEVGLVQSPYGWHVVKRLPLAPDPLVSRAVLARAPLTDKARVKHILLGWTERHGADPRGAARDRSTLEKLVKDTVAKLRGGDKIEPLMKELSEDPRSATSGDAYDVAPDASLSAPFKAMALRLKVGEVGVARAPLGLHIIQRVE
jgi:parvulin-like peptidyl-prolyl cis-trans isomerase-like protein